MMTEQVEELDEWAAAIKQMLDEAFASGKHVILYEETHGEPDFAVLEKIREALWAGRDSRIDLRLDPRNLLQGQTPLEGIGLTPTEREQLRQIRMEGAT
jgi:hypothetical protein